MNVITPELRRAIKAAGHQPARLLDPETNATYLLVRDDDFVVLPIDWSGDLSAGEQDALLLEMGRSVGWDDSDANLHDDLDPREP